MRQKFSKVTRGLEHLTWVPDLRFCKKETLFPTVLGNCPLPLIFWKEYIVLLFLSVFLQQQRSKGRGKILVILNYLTATVSQTLTEANTNLNHLLQSQHPGDSFYRGTFKIIHRELKLFIDENSEDFRRGTNINNFCWHWNVCKGSFLIELDNMAVYSGSKIHTSVLYKEMMSILIQDIEKGHPAVF